MVTPSARGKTVVGVDGSPSSVEAMRWAARQAELTGGELHAVTAWHMPTTYGWIPPVADADWAGNVPARSSSSGRRQPPRSPPIHSHHPSDRRTGMSVTTPEQRTEWIKLTDRLSADHQGHDVAIEVLDPESGDSSLVERLPFDGITYDHKDDVVVISVGGRAPRYPVVLRHLIPHPQEILFDLIPQGAALKITDSTGTTTLVSLLRHAGHESGRRA